MSSVADLTQDAARGEHANRLLSDPLLLEALEKLEAHYVDSWKRTSTHDMAGRERAYLQIQLVTDFRSQLRTMTESGHLARSLLEKWRRR